MFHIYVKQNVTDGNDTKQLKQLNKSNKFLHQFQNLTNIDKSKFQLVDLDEFRKTYNYDPPIKGVPYMLKADDYSVGHNPFTYFKQYQSKSINTSLSDQIKQNIPYTSNSKSGNEKHIFKYQTNSYKTFNKNNGMKKQHVPGKLSLLRDIHARSKDVVINPQVIKAQVAGERKEYYARKDARQKHNST